MKHSINRVLQAMIEYDSGDPMRIHHFIKVHAFAAYIGRQEGLDKDTQEILELAAIVHDIGIHLAVENYGSASAKYQEMIGPGEAEAMLEELGLPENVIKRVSYLVAHHHTYDLVDGPDYQILLEADYIANASENGYERRNVENFIHKIMRTESGKALARAVFCV